MVARLVPEKKKNRLLQTDDTVAGENFCCGTK